MDLQPITVAIADDHVPSRKVMRNFLLKGNYQVIMEADNGQKLLTQLESAATLPDICLLDINMPEMNGLETARLVKAKWPSIKILAISGDDLYNLIRIKHLGADGFINKNCTQVELNEAVNKVLHS
jgi:Response regulator containing a CheY-like receiver domain and an HTH DNA-binding domain